MNKFCNKILNHLKNHNGVEPNKCQKEAIEIISLNLNLEFKSKLSSFFKKKKNIYLHGTFGVGKSILIKALNFIYPSSLIFHFSDLVFHLQKNFSKRSDPFKKFKNCDVILIDEFFINNLTNLILFEKFFDFSIKNKILLIMTGNKALDNIYNDPVNKELTKKIKIKLVKNFIIHSMKSKIDYRSKKLVNNDFFFVGLDKEIKKKQNNLIKKFAINSTPRNLDFRREGFKFVVNKYYGNVIDLSFNEFFKKQLVFKDYELIAKKVNFIILRNLIQLNDNSQDLAARFIFFIDVLYENKNILSLSTDTELDKIYLGNVNSFEFKRTISRLKEMRSSDYIDYNLKLVFKNKK